MEKYELTPIYSSQKSFNGKALIETSQGVKKLYSYNTLVAEIKNSQAFVYNTQSNTTVKHIKEFLLQSGFKAENKKQIEKDYCNN